MANKLISELTTQAAIVNADYVEVQVSTESVTKKATTEVVTKVERDARIAQDNVIELGAGLNADGTYATPSGTNYLDSTTSIQNAVETLDGVVSSGSLVTTTVSVSSANLNNAGIAPFQLIAAPGATAVIELISCSIRLLYNAAAVECGTQKLVIQYDTGASHFTEWANAFIESGVTVINKATWTSNVVMITNKKIELTFDGAANPTAGDATLKVFLTYKLWDWSV